MRPRPTIIYEIRSKCLYDECRKYREIVNKNDGIGVVFRTHSPPIARWVETGIEGSTLAIRLQRPFVMVQDFPKKSSLSRRC